MGTENRSPEFVIKSLIAGGIAGCAAKTVVAPLDRVKILFQTNNPHFERFQGSMKGVVGASREILVHDGWLGLFRGHTATLLRIFPYAAIKFMAYEQYKNLLSSRNTYTIANEFAAGSLAGMTSVVVTYPLEHIRVRMAFETKRLSTPAQHQRDTTRVKWLNLYRGIIPTLIGMIPYAGVSFAVHRHLSDLFVQYIPASIHPSPPLPHRPGNKPRLRAWAELLSGGLAGMAAQTSSYPLEIVRRRMQVMDSKMSATRIIGVGKEIWRTKGWRGFWVGLSIGYVKVFPMVGVSFAVYEQAKHWLRISR